jgi:BirA family biotin operon repressor/biotin-[acetyl-CoA-carboxylase] ligase
VSSRAGRRVGVSSRAARRVGVSGRPFISRLERFASVPSTQPIVAAWLEEGTPEVAVAVADEQTRGRGRQGREWHAPRGAALLVSLGFRPSDLALRHAWRMGATVALAMLEAAEAMLETAEAGLDLAERPATPGMDDATAGARARLWLKWPNDLVAQGADGSIRKLAGVLGETVAAGDRVERAVVGIGLNADWAARDFPADLAASMTSLRELSGGRPIDRDVLLERFLERLESAYEMLRAGRFDVDAWAARQVTTGRGVEVLVGDERIEGMATGVDGERGSLLVESAGGERSIDSGEVVRCRLLDVPARL